MGSNCVSLGFLPPNYPNFPDFSIRMLVNNNRVSSLSAACSIESGVQNYVMATWLHPCERLSFFLRSYTVCGKNVFR